MGIEQTFSISANEIVSGEYFSRANEPTLTFNPSRRLIYVNSACLKSLPDANYALFTISASEKRLSLCPCDAGELDTVRIRSAGANRNKPKHIRCHEDLIGKLLSLMQWGSSYRYKIPGYPARNDRETIIVFDLASAKAYESQTGLLKHTPQMGQGFGEAFSERRGNPLIRTFVQNTEVIIEEMEYIQNDNA